MLYERTVAEPGMEEAGVDLGFLERDYQAWELDSGQFPSKVGNITLST